MKRAIFGALVGIFCMVFIGWYSGLDMFQRGNDQATIAMLSIMFGFAGFVLAAPTSLFFGSHK